MPSELTRPGEKRSVIQSAKAPGKRYCVSRYSCPTWAEGPQGLAERHVGGSSDSPDCNAHEGRTRTGCQHTVRVAPLAGWARHVRLAQEDAMPVLAARTASRRTIGGRRGTTGVNPG